MPAIDNASRSRRAVRVDTSSSLATSSAVTRPRACRNRRVATRRSARMAPHSHPTWTPGGHVDVHADDMTSSETPSIEAVGLTKTFGSGGGGVEPSTASTSSPTAGRSPPCSGPTAPASRRSCGPSPRCCAPMRDAASSPGSTPCVSRSSSGGRSGSPGRPRPSEPAMTGRENLQMVATLFGHRRRRRRPRRRRCSPSSASPMPATGWSASTRAACAGASTSAPAWSAGRGCCCSTSRRPGSIRAAASNCGRRSACSSRGGTDVLLTTQYLEEADQLAHRVTIVDHGPRDRDRHPGGAEVAGRARRRRGARPPRRTRRRRARRADRDRRRDPSGGRTDPAHHRRRRRRQRSVGRGRPRARRPTAGARRHRPAPPDARRGLPHPHRQPDRAAA